MVLLVDVLPHLHTTCADVAADCAIAAAAGAGAGVAADYKAQHRSTKPQPRAKIAKTYNSGDLPVVTHLTTSLPVRCLSKAERTGSPVFNVLWSYVETWPEEV
ncbi:hypothetical protein EK21DRAFT_82785 [Setomelanomma holmii]|uniref:Uncharacterized protein n=1 Tax=Setomelanomma holmii TaxID=210430 RepID=A0A9P4GWB6_9PLEO|nr:hypothetical protein EK21DRAFT_82785 [Setomelanomma holmii]